MSKPLFSIVLLPIVGSVLLKETLGWSTGVVVSGPTPPCFSSGAPPSHSLFGTSKLTFSRISVPLFALEGGLSLNLYAFFFPLFFFCNFSRDLCLFLFLPASFLSGGTNITQISFFSSPREFYVVFCASTFFTCFQLASLCIQVMYSFCFPPAVDFYPTFPEGNDRVLFFSRPFQEILP